MTNQLEDFGAAIGAAAARNAREDLDGYYSDFAQHCESPIEHLMAFSLIYIVRSEQRSEYEQDGEGDETFYWAFLSEAGTDLLSEHLMLPPWHSIAVIPQIAVGEYRADFGVAIQCRSKRKHFVIECDGHNFHERTKAQARRDRERDRWMTERDIIVLRFTGNELWSDPLKCARQAIDLIWRKACQMREESFESTESKRSMESHAPLM